MKKFKDFIKTNKKYVAVASAALLSFGAIGTLPVLAKMDPTMYKIANVLGIEADLEDYGTVVGTMETSSEGIGVGIGEVIYDQENHKLRIITYITTPETVEEDTIWSTFVRVHINGNEINGGNYTERKIIDENTVAFIEDHHIDEVLTGDLDISIRIPQVQVNDKMHYGNWKFIFI